MGKVKFLGATGTTRQAAVSALGNPHDVVQVDTSRGTYQVDVTNAIRVGALFRTKKSGFCGKDKSILVHDQHA